MDSTARTRFERPVAFRVLSRLLDVPELVIRRTAGEPVEIDGRVLNRHVQFLIELARRTGQDRDEGSVAERRAALARMAGVAMPNTRGVHVTTRVIPGPESALTIRVYRPHRCEATPPAIVYLHGGGWVVGDLDTHDGTCRLLAVESGCAVVSVDYRLAPEHPWPAAVHDAVAAYRWVVANAADLSVDSRAVGVMGDSAGGNLAAVVSNTTRDLDVAPPVAQGLVYPATNFLMESRSLDLFADGFFLTRESMHWFRDHYLPERSSWQDPTASPLLNPDLSGAAPALVWTAGFDPLRDEGRAYAEELEKAGVNVRHRCMDDQVHGFFGMGVIPGCLDLAGEMCSQMGVLMRTNRPG